MPIHPGIKHPQIGEFLPYIAWHFREQRPLPMNNFILTQHKKEVLMKSVEQRKGEVSLMKSAKDRIQLHILEKVVHPTQVPFETKTQSAEISWARNSGPGG